MFDLCVLHSPCVLCWARARASAQPHFNLRMRSVFEPRLARAAIPRSRHDIMSSMLRARARWNWKCRPFTSRNAHIIHVIRYRILFHQWFVNNILINYILTNYKVPDAPAYTTVIILLDRFLCTCRLAVSFSPMHV